MDSIEKMSQVLREYYMDVFVSPEEGVPESGSSSLSVVTRDPNLKLIADISFEEFTEAMKQMHPDKVSDPDGLNPVFYQNFRKLMGHEVCIAANIGSKETYSMLT